MLAISEDIESDFLPGEIFYIEIDKRIELYLPLWDTFIAYRIGTLLYRTINITTTNPI